jgi:hypothetical protein
MKKKYTFHHEDQFEEKKIFKGLKTSVKLEKELEKIRGFLFKKYDIDYVSADAIDETSQYFMVNFNHDKWQDYTIASGLIYTWPEISRSSIFSKLPADSGAVEFFTAWEQEVPEVNALRASVTGELKTAFAIMFNNNKGNKIQFSLTMRNGYESIASMSYVVYQELLKDLKSFENILDPFMDDFKRNGRLTI